MTEDQFIDEYQPKLNNLATHGGWEGMLFDTSKEEMDFVLSYANDFLKQKHVWTWIEVDGKQYISAGYHLINRQGYFITEKPWETGLEEIECDDDFWVDDEY